MGRARARAAARLRSCSLSRAWKAEWNVGAECDGGCDAVDACCGFGMGFGSGGLGFSGRTSTGACTTGRTAGTMEGVRVGVSKVK